MQKKLFLYFGLLGAAWSHAVDLTSALTGLTNDLGGLSHIFSALDSKTEQQVSDALVQILLHTSVFYETDFPHYRAALFNQLHNLQANHQFLKHKELQVLIDQLPRIINDTLTFKEFNKRGKLEFFLASFYQMQEYTLDGVTITIVTAPSQKYLAIQQQLVSLFSTVFFDAQLLNVQDIEIIIVTMLAGQRPLQSNISADAQALSNNCLLQTLRLVGNNLEHSRPDFLMIVRYINWLRINPVFLKSTNMLYMTMENQQGKSPIWRVTPPLLTLFVWPKEVLSKSYKASTPAQILEQSLGKHYFGGTSDLQQALDNDKNRDLRNIMQELSSALGQQL